MTTITRVSTKKTSSLSRRRALALLGAVPMGFALTGCISGSNTTPTGQTGSTVDFAARFADFEPAEEPNGDLSKVVWPEFITRAGGDIRALYEFQILNGDLMRYMPCFCGCGRSDGHRSNRNCYVKAVNADGSVVFDSMAPT